MSDTTPKHRPAALRPRALLVVITVIAGLSSCGGDDHNNCFNCQSYTPYEVSYGLVAGNFNGNGFPSIVQTSAVKGGVPPLAGFLKSFLSTGAGAFAAPVLTNDGADPLYLATADLNGDGLPDVVSASFEN